MIVTPTNKSVTALDGMHLFHADISNCSMRVRMVLAEKELPWTSHHLDLRKKETVTPEYFGIHPKGLVPTLVTTAWCISNPMRSSRISTKPIRIRRCSRNPARNAR